MNKIWLSTGVLALVALLVAGISWQSTHKSLSPEDTTLQDCKSISYSGPNAVNLLFFSTKSNAEKYSSYLLARKPFDTNKKKFNVYYVDDYTPPCKLYRSIALLCDSPELTKKSASCPHDYVFVLKEEDSKIRSSAYGIVGSINTAHPLTVMQHEFGHLFANFAEEYTPADLPSGQPNCKQSCTDFGEYASSCFKECSDSSHMRSIENGVMRTLDSDKYGNYNEKTIFSIINALSPEPSTTGFAIQESSSCSTENQIIVKAKYTENGPILQSATTTSGCAPSKSAGPSQATITKDGTKIASFTLPQFQKIFTDAPSENGMDGETYSPSESFYFSVPASEGDQLEFSDSQNPPATLSISKMGATPCRI